MKPNRRLAILDSFRGIAALIVVFHHIFVFNLPIFEEYCPEWLFKTAAFVSDLNRLAVMFFFVLSGFVIYLASAKLDFFVKTDLNYYLYRRFRRILPLYWITLFFSWLMGAWGQALDDPAFSPLNLLGNLLFFQTSSKVPPYWAQPYGLNGPLWSLAYEMFYYLFFPGLLWLTRVIWNKSTDADKLLVVSFLLACLAILAKKLIFIPHLSFMALLPLWMAGYYLASLYTQQKNNDGLTFALSLGMLTSWLFKDLLPSDTWISLAQAWCVIVIPAYLIYRIPALLTIVNSMFRPLNGILTPIGEGSYAIYLLHYPAIWLMADRWQLPLGTQILILVILCWLSILLEQWISQRPFSWLKRNYV